MEPQHFVVNSLANLMTRSFFVDEIEQLISRLDEARVKIETLLPGIDPKKEIYPGWTIHHFLAHMTGWDDAVIASLRAHIGGEASGTPAARGIDYFNNQTVETREILDLEKVEQEWSQTRLILKEILRSMSQEKFQEPIIVPWGGTKSVTQLIEIFIHHEAEEHRPDLETWLANPDRPLLDRH